MEAPSAAADSDDSDSDGDANTDVKGGGTGKDDATYTMEERREADARRSRRQKKRELTFPQFDRLDSVLAACGGDAALTSAVIQKLAAMGGGRGGKAKRNRRNRQIAEGLDSASSDTGSLSAINAALPIGPFTDPFRLAAAVAAQVADDDALLSKVKSLNHAIVAELRLICSAEEEYELLNFSMRLERAASLRRAIDGTYRNLGHVLAWTRKSNVENDLRPRNFPYALASKQRLQLLRDASNASKELATEEGGTAPTEEGIVIAREKGCEFRAMLGCPNIDLIELLRLILAFSMRKDFNQVERLYSLDHSDLFVTNDRHPAVSAMLQGIPHSLLLANLKGELQVLVPVLRTVRPIVQSQPFTTMLVLDRSSERWNTALSSRYYMYPVHVSTSFLLTKGLNAALYLMLLRLLHRDYDEVYRLTDSIATDTKLIARAKKSLKR